MLLPVFLLLGAVVFPSVQALPPPKSKYVDDDVHISNNQTLSYRATCVASRMLVKGALTTVAVVPLYEASLLVDWMFQLIEEALVAGGQSASEAASTIDQARAAFKQDIEAIQNWAPQVFSDASRYYVRSLALKLINQLTASYRLWFTATGTGLNCITSGLLNASDDDINAINQAINNFNNLVNQFNNDIPTEFPQTCQQICPPFLSCYTVCTPGGSISPTISPLPTVSNVPQIDISVAQETIHIPTNEWLDTLAASFLTDNVVDEILNLDPNLPFANVDIGPDLVPLVQSQLIDGIVVPTVTNIQDYRFISTVIFGFAVGIIVWNTIQPLLKAVIPEGRAKGFIMKYLLPSLKISKKLKPGLISRRGGQKAIKQSFRNTVRLFLHDVIFHLHAMIFAGLAFFKLFLASAQDAIPPSMAFAQKMDNETQNLQIQAINVLLDAYNDIYKDIAFTGAFLQLEKIEKFIEIAVDDISMGLNEKVLFDCTALDLLNGTVQFLSATKITEDMVQLYDAFENFTDYLRNEFKPTPVTFARRAVSEAASARDALASINIWGSLTIAALLYVIESVLKAILAPLIPQSTLEYLDLMPNRFDDDFDEQ